MKSQQDAPGRRPATIDAVKFQDLKSSVVHAKGGSFETTVAQTKHTLVMFHSPRKYSQTPNRNISDYSK